MARDKEKQRAYFVAWRKANPEKMKAYSSAWRKANPEKHRAQVAAWNKAHPEECRARNAAFDKAHPEKGRARKAAWRKANPDKDRACKAAWCKANQELRRIYEHNRRVRKTANGGKLSKGISEKLLLRQKEKCAICKKSVKKYGHHLDHIVPISKGGKNIDANIQLLCPACNHKKSAKDPIQFMQSLGYLL